MLYCGKCKVHVTGTPRRCPLCQGELTGAPEGINEFRQNKNTGSQFLFPSYEILSSLMKRIL